MTASQLEGFRQIMASRKQTTKARSFAIASGKGGVGKSTIALGLSMALALQERKVLLLDGDAGLADLNILMGINPRFHWGDYLDGKCSFEELVEKQVHGIDFVHGFSGVLRKGWLEEQSMEKVLATMVDHAHLHDFHIVDVGAGLAESNLVFCTSVDLLILVLGKELTALADAYGTLKTVVTRKPRQKVAIVVNGVRDGEQARLVYGNLMRLAHQFLGTRPPLLAWLPEDSAISKALRQQKPMLQAFPQAPWSQAVLQLAQAICGGQFNEK